MSKKEKVCLEESQVKRLAGDAYRMGKGQTEGICDTVREIVEEAVPRSERIGKAKKAGKKKENKDDPVSMFKKAKGFLDGLGDDFF